MNEKDRDPLQLSSLPQPPLPADDPWPGIVAALRRDRRRQMTNWALAAGVSLVAGLTWLNGSAPIGPRNGATPTELRGWAQETPRQTPQQTPQQTPRATAADSDPARPAAGDPVASLMALSQQLEQRLKFLRARAGPIPSGALVYQVEIEDLVAQVDEALSRRPDSPELWSQRVNLLLDLDQLYRQELRPEYGSVASL